MPIIKAANETPSSQPAVSKENGIHGPEDAALPSVYLCDPVVAADPDLAAAYFDLLSSEERGRLGRIRREADRHSFLASRALVRTALSRHAKLDPKAWRFTVNRWGRPAADPTVHGTTPGFSLSHTRGLIACAVSDWPEIGVDVEGLADGLDVSELAARHFSDSERRQLSALPPDERSDHFIALWVLKEAYVKALGRGLSLPLNGCSFRLEGQRVRLENPVAGTGAPNGWSFGLMRPTPRHWLALALPKGAAQVIPLPVWHVPLRGIDALGEAVGPTATRWWDAGEA